MIVHVDANTFYASCERLFRPDLIDKPIAVLSNNDGIIIALNKECKEIGFHRGDVYYQERANLAQKNVAVFSSNYTLYADISNRLNLLYMSLAPEIEIYSIDESFLYFPDWKICDLVEIGHQLRNRAERYIGIPVSVGIAPTKTLSKMCNKLAKKRGGVCAWGELDQEAELAKYPVGDIWGIGWKKTSLLSRHGIHTALELKNYPLHLAKKNLTITGMRTVQELNGVAAIERVDRDKRQNICSSRSFCRPVPDLEGLQSALSSYTQEAVKKMREEKQACRLVSVYLGTNSFSEVGEQYHNAATAELPFPSSYLPDIVKIALELLDKIYRPGYRYRKVMILLLGLESDRNVQQELFIKNEDKQKHDAIMKACDTVNERYGRGTISLGIKSLVKEYDNTESAWGMKRDFLSPEYTTKISDVPKVK